MPKSRVSSKKDEAVALLTLEETNAWFRYLRSIRGKRGDSYQELESWAWAQLQVTLGSIQARRQKIAA